MHSLGDSCMCTDQGSNLQTWNIGMEQRSNNALTKWATRPGCWVLSKRSATAAESLNLNQQSWHWLQQWPWLLEHRVLTEECASSKQYQNNVQATGLRAFPSHPILPTLAFHQPSATDFCLTTPILVTGAGKNSWVQLSWVPSKWARARELLLCLPLLSYLLIRPFSPVRSTSLQVSSCHSPQRVAATVCDQQLSGQFLKAQSQAGSSSESALSLWAEDGRRWDFLMSLPWAPDLCVSLHTQPSPCSASYFKF